MVGVIEQGALHYCHFEDPLKDRPVLILSRTELNSVREKVVVAIVTRTIRQIPLEIPVGKTEGLPKEGVVSLGDLYTVSKNLLSAKRGELSSAKKTKMAEGLKLLFNLDTREK